MSSAYYLQQCLCVLCRRGIPDSVRECCLAAKIVHTWRRPYLRSAAILQFIMVNVVSRQHGHLATEFFIPMSADEARQQRIRLGNRQGGRGEIRRQLRQTCSARTSASASASTPMAPPLSLPRFVPGVPYGKSTATNYRPAGYRSETASSVSSVSTGEWGHETDYSDVEFAEEDSAFLWDSLIDLAPVNPQPDTVRSHCQQPMTTSAECGGPPYHEAPVAPPPPVIYQIIVPSRPEVREVACDTMPLPPSPPPRPVSIDCGTDPLPIACENRAVDTHPPPHLQLMDLRLGRRPCLGHG